MNSKHEFAICLIKETTAWYQDFTSDLEVFISKLMKLESQGKWNNFDMSSLFQIINDKCTDILSVPKRPGVLPEFTYRVILFYSRSSTLPVWSSGNKLATEMLEAPYFFFDAMYIHSKPEKNTKPQEVYDFITDLESENKVGYFFENSTNTKRLYSNMAQLLAHPMQRPEQAEYIISTV